MPDVLEVYSADLDASGGPAAPGGIVIDGGATYTLGVLYPVAGGIVLGGSVAFVTYTGFINVYSADGQLAGGPALAQGIVLGGTLAVNSYLAVYSADGHIPSAGPYPWGSPIGMIYAPVTGLIVSSADGDIPVGVIAVAGGIVLNGSATFHVSTKLPIRFTVGPMRPRWTAGRMDR